MCLVSIYCPAHFGNFYECAAWGELSDYFKELASWGINGIGTWFDPANMCDPFSQDPLYKWAREMSIMQLERKRRILAAARDNGLKLTLCVTPNVVYIDQLRPELAARATAQDIGPNLCPSEPEARKIILYNCENIFKYLAEGGIRLDYVLAALRDYGGCGCGKCAPWVKTFLELWEEIVPILRAYHPNARVQFCTWWATSEEIEVIKSYLEKMRPDWVDGINLSLGYSTELPLIELPEGYQKTIFLHISYGSTHSDKYGIKGAVVAPRRLETVFRKLAYSNISGIQAYSEGIFEDLNKFLVAHLSQSPLSNVQDLVRQYCKTYFGTNDGDTEGIVASIYALENLRAEEATHVADTLESIGKRYNLQSNWRFMILLIRAKVGALEAEIGNEQQWEEAYRNLRTEERDSYIDRIDALVNERRRLLEYLERHIYRVGAQCHLLDIDTDYKPWQSWKNRSEPGEATAKPLGPFLP